MLKFKRGDTFPFKVKLIFPDKTPVTINDIDTLFVTCKNGHGDDAIQLFQKNKNEIEIDENGYCHIVFEPKDTENLQLGVYDFDIEITLADGYRKTKTASFELQYDITEHKGE